MSVADVVDLVHGIIIALPLRTTGTFQEIVPLNAGNVLGAEDKGPAYRWLALIRRALNPPTETGPKLREMTETPRSSGRGSASRICSRWRRATGGAVAEEFGSFGRGIGAGPRWRVLFGGV
uniref:Uncharacterized protein n=1 Tax=Ananas comosus var. bracteatus TaxID=296719 RepID=A0A6V7PCW6_ANACO|nr:unnamed protein product [Ananas comosus var. bracteatus]